MPGAIHTTEDDESHHHGQTDDCYGTFVFRSDVQKIECARAVLNMVAFSVWSVDL